MHPPITSRSKLEAEFSAGAVVVRRMHGQWWVAVIEPGRRGSAQDPTEVVALPKGNIQTGENSEQAARREVLEETGLRAERVAALGSIRYVYIRNWDHDKKIAKEVRFYLMEYRSGRIGAITSEMKQEVNRTYWLPLQEAIEKLSYTGHRQVAKRALQQLERRF